MERKRVAGSKSECKSKSESESGRGDEGDRQEARFG